MQPGLTDKILAEVKDGNLVPIATSKQCGHEYTPAAATLGSHKNDPPFDPVKFGFDYRQVVGMIMYLINTRPDIQVPVHQCTQFSHNPREAHGKALRRIARYLKGTEALV